MKYLKYYFGWTCVIVFLIAAGVILFIPLTLLWIICRGGAFILDCADTGKPLSALKDAHKDILRDVKEGGPFAFLLYEHKK